MRETYLKTDGRGISKAPEMCSIGTYFFSVPLAKLHCALSGLSVRRSVTARNGVPIHVNYLKATDLR